MIARLFAAAAATAMLSGAALAQTPATTPAPTAPAAAAPAAPAATARVTAAGDLVATAKASGQFTTLLKALDATNLTSVLQKTPNLTVFAPTDTAFAALPAGQLDELMKPANAATLQKIMTYHVINARVDAAKIKGAKGDVKTVEGENVLLDGSGETLKVDTATIVQSDVMASNGILHVVDKVLMPPSAQVAAATGTAVSASASVPVTPAPALAAPATTPPVNPPAPAAATPAAAAAPATTTP